MRLRDLDPKLAGTVDRGVLTFLCPYPGHTHKLRVPITSGPAQFDGERVWHAEGSFPDALTITPSIDADSWTRSPERKHPQPCWHGFITNGEVG